MEYELYADVWFLTNFLMDSLALVLAGKLMRQPVRPGRLLLGSFTGTAGSMLFFLGLENYTLYRICVHFLVNPLMVYLCYRSRKKEFLCQWAITYVAYVLLGGVLSFSMVGRKGSGYFLVCLAGALLFLEAAGRALRHVKGEKETLYDLLLVTGEGKLSVKGFYDTGNLLTDPLGNRPVHIIKREILQSQIQKEQLLTRLIPYHSLGQESGLLEAVTLEGMYIVREGCPLYLKKPVFGLADEKLFQDDRCDVILNGKSMEN
ncbi:sigma-E processing peptidase SpoIIGA [Eubacterium sp. 14-2]|uniref:sigma-E processing peptidase SpoIIGA n=1 Tax=Eubacterium sp. 14-2 TaxID=1235790 RepID=UPI000336FE7E|nr:sigma-E processing peptidase SpoIIGA [Eubacterium sp. 14-2]EOT25495.1 sigma-E processing peptidase SpoIIGA [Eubacterium sp. 14-2]